MISDILTKCTFKKVDLKKIPTFGDFLFYKMNDNELIGCPEDIREFLKKEKICYLMLREFDSNNVDVDCTIFDFYIFLEDDEIQLYEIHNIHYNMLLDVQILELYDRFGSFRKVFEFLTI